MRKECLKSILIWIVTGLIFLAGLLFTGSVLFKAGLLLLFIIPAVSGLSAYFAAKGITASVDLPATCDKGKELKGVLKLFCEGRMPVSRAVVCLAAGNMLTGEKTEMVSSLGVTPAGTTEKDIVLSSSRCGYINVFPEKVYVTDLFGIIPIRVKNKMSGRTVSVLPETFIPEIHIEVPQSYSDDAEVWSQVKKGNDITEVFALRDYVPGDRLSQIHWKLSGKRNELIVREPSLPVEKSLLVFWDKNSCEAGPEKMDAMAEAVSSVAQKLSEEGVLFTLGWTDGRFPERVEVEYSEDLLEAIPRMIKTGRDPEGDPGFRMLKDDGSYGHFSKVIYFAGDMEDFEAFCRGMMIFMICGETAPVTDGAPAETYYYNAADYKEELSELEL